MRQQRLELHGQGGLDPLRSPHTRTTIPAAGSHNLFPGKPLGLVKHLTGSPAVVEILADAGYQGLGAQTGGRVVTPPHRKFKKNPPDWYEEIYERQRKAHSSRRIRVEHGIAHLKNWRALARHLGRREHMSDTIQAVAGLLSHQQTATRGAGQPE
uniref:transposase family protein n=1 Tax=Streptomyces sp. MNP-20 TaxID=2721165 RepID=UPI0020A6ADF6